MKLYPTRTDAKAEFASLKGWPQARIVKVNTVKEDGRTPTQAWAIECAPNQYMQEDGYVRS